VVMHASSNTGYCEWPNIFLRKVGKRKIGLKSNSPYTQRTIHLQFPYPYEM